MAPEIISLVQTVSLDAIKILGPAIIAAYAAYRAGAIQLEVKLRELEKNHQFQARENIFTHLKDRIAHIEKEEAKLNLDLGRIMGEATSMFSEENSSSRDFVELMSMGIRSASRLVPFEINSILDEMRVSNLASSREFKLLLSRHDDQVHLTQPASFEQLRSSILVLMETYNILSLCARLLLQKQMERVFAPYLADGK